MESRRAQVVSPLCWLGLVQLDGVTQGIAFDRFNIYKHRTIGYAPLPYAQLMPRSTVSDPFGSLSDGGVPFKFHASLLCPRP